MTPTLLLILDGWGIAPAGEGNAPSRANTPNLDKLFATMPHTTLDASGRAVGLPAGYIGNSEVGHLNIGAGRVVFQDMTRIDVAMEDGTLTTNAVFNELIATTKASGGVLHLAGLLSDGGVHSHIAHIKALAEIASNKGLAVRVHCFMDGRDTDPHGGEAYLQDLQDCLNKLQDARIATICGRFYAMDRDKRWDRVAKAWELLVHGKGANAPDALTAIRAAYAKDITDEFVEPTRIGAATDSTSMWRDGDGLFLCNFRADRMRELVQALTVTDFDGFARGAIPHLAGIASMVAYDATFTLPVAFPKEALRMGLGEVVAQGGYKQLRLAETEKYAHVTYFFNGGIEEPFAGEDRVLVPSPRDVATYDLAPAMSCYEVTDKFIEAWNSGIYTFFVCNLANGDMVGHTGVLDAAIKACEAVDVCVGRMVEAVIAKGGRMLIIADHGNCEVMINAQGQPQTAHTTNPVPCILVDPTAPHTLHPGKLADVAPTLLHLWGMKQPKTMTGTSLVEK